ncbi:ankyrin repeat domain-containing protein [Erwinia sp. E_sp_B04_7]|uniref:ankyrin repeat domain-containing protein n=1 Tax=unclassified Erwinia TaxID=2622719 RepID=UPI0030CE7C4C
MKKFKNWFMKLAVVMAVASLAGLILGCSNMKVPPAEDYFSGTQLELAQAIRDIRVDDVDRIAKSTNLNKPGAKDMTLLFYALQVAANNNKESLDIVSLLVKKGADPLYRVPDFGSAAGVTARSDNPAFMKALLEGGMSPNVQSNYKPVISIAASDHSFEVLKLLVDSGADVNARDSAGKTAIIDALARMELDQVVYLLKKGADPTLKTIPGWEFSNMLDDVIKRESGSNTKTKNKLNEIKELAIKNGMKWPPMVH